MMSDSALATYLDEVRRIRSTKAGTAETSYYPAIALMLNVVGAALKPRVYCLHHPSGESGIPDFGLFEQAQFKRDETPTWTKAVAPERGVVEVKGAAHKMATLLASKQIKDQYLPAYGLLLATNLWQFRLINKAGTVIESFDLADNESGFWALAGGSRAKAPVEPFASFLTRCLLLSSR